MKLREAFLSTIQQVNRYGSSRLLQSIPWKDLGRIDRAASRDTYLARRRNDALRACKTILRDIEDYGAHQQLAQIVGEARIYTALREYVPVEAIPESSESSPDFRIGRARDHLYAEAKVLMPSAVSTLQRKEMAESLDWQASVQGRTGLHLRESLTLFYKRPGKPYDPRSPKLVAEALIEKIQQNVKRSQFSLGRTVLVVSLEYLVTIMPPDLAIQRQFRDPDTGGFGTGELWLVASGRAGEQAARAPEFTGETPTPETVDKQGILLEYPFVAGVIFFIEGHFYSIVNRRKLNGATGVLVNRFSRHVLASTG